MNKLDRAAKRLAKTVLKHGSVVIRFHQVDNEVELGTVDIAAAPGDGTFEEESDGLVQVIETSDWLIDPQALIIAGSVIVPSRGDWLAELDSSGVVVEEYAVAAMAGVPPFEKLSRGYLLRIHSLRRKMSE
ncbi:MAG: hypothetical protein COA78_24770 [Blastopirellula sp.]|nr:MAG: hypothetical protein COA78_24770 [Blastopirellula sp.]